MDERAEEILPGGEVAVDRPDAHPCVLGDLGHGDLLPVAPDELDGGIEHSLAVAERVLARLAGGGMRHAPIIAAGRAAAVRSRASASCLNGRYRPDIQAGGEGDQHADDSSPEMKAMRFHEYGDADVLRYEDVEQPLPGAGEVRIRVAATSFNPVDDGIRGGYLRDRSR